MDLEQFLAVRSQLKELDRQLTGNSSRRLTPRRLFVLAALVKAEAAQRTKAIVADLARKMREQSESPYELHRLRHGNAVGQVLRELEHMKLVKLARTGPGRAYLYHPSQRARRVLREAAK